MSQIIGKEELLQLEMFFYLIFSKLNCLKRSDQSWYSTLKRRTDENG